MLCASFAAARPCKEGLTRLIQEAQARFF